jgi:hypothetical protein
VSVSASRPSQQPVAVLSYFDILLIVVAAPIMLLIGVPAAGYGYGAGAWIVLRAVGVAVERVASAGGDARSQIGLRLAYMLSRLFGLALTVILVRSGDGKNDGLTALAVIVFAFTVQLGTSAITRPKTR